MGLFDKLHERKTPPGLEWQILKRLPRAALFGSLLPLALAAIARLMPMADGFDGAKRVKSVDIFAIATEVTFLTALFTIAIGCIVVHVMKGPAYVADAYPVAHSDRPRIEPPER